MTTVWPSIFRLALVALLAGALLSAPHALAPLGAGKLALADDDDDGDDDGPSGGGSSGGGTSGGGGSSGGGSSGGGGSPADDDDDDDRDEERGERRDDRDDRDDRQGHSVRDEDARSGLARLIDLLRGRTDPPADRDDRFRPGEILAVDLSAEARGRLARLGFEVREQRRLPAMGVTVTRLAPPVGRTLPEALELARAADPATLFDLNHLYGGLVCEGCWVEAATALRLEPAHCRVRSRLGLLDTAVDRDHPALRGARIRTRSVLPSGTPPASADHGTAVASLLVGAPPLGLLPEAELLVAEVFGRAAAGDEADAWALVAGLDWLVQSRARVINASLAGPANRVVELALYLARRQGVVIVAAAGNGGPTAPPAYPAAYEGVIAVTAVDRALAPWRRANRGAYIDFAAPGVAVPVAAPGGGVRAASGTSFAAPFVAAALAVTAGGGDPRPALVALVRSARDLGAPGRDPVFGHGLVQAAGCRG